MYPTPNAFRNVEVVKSFNLTTQGHSSERNLQGTIVPHRPSFKVILHPFKHRLSPEGAIVPGELQSDVEPQP